MVQIHEAEWLNTLGMLANRGIDVVIRHSFFDHGYNHLVDQNFNPLPSKDTQLQTHVLLMLDCYKKNTIKLEGIVGNSRSLELWQDS
ncbi:hypothetical protein P7K49_024233 [Saguinus oedipus]|uniref:Uncharacterized protein n=1 Tax=Saguinus oedipus TaxID=9490 RepID=A0ABQ9URA8_SAGOE|nr:hypothetical protein P7K49_024233 [Saguinus oedipus]